MMEMMGDMVGWFMSLALVFMILIGGLHFLPAVIGFVRGHQSKWAIFALNLLLGWTLIGWIVALIWSLTGVRE